MVGGSLRHLRSLRMLRYDGGRINTLLDESENERMHLLTFLEIAGRKGPFFRAAVVVAQGVMWNFFFLLYLASPNTGELGGESEIVTSPREMDDCAVIHKYHCAFLRRMGERARGRKASPFSLSSHSLFFLDLDLFKKKKKKKKHTPSSASSRRRPSRPTPTPSPRSTPGASGPSTGPSSPRPSRSPTGTCRRRRRCAT